ncbi:MAG: MFS transporter [Meiothermus sp.]|nr:MFS transporter [Meiothermus sp.]
MLRFFPWVRWLETQSPGVWGAWFYLGFWGIVGSYIGFLNVYFVRVGFSEVAVGFLNSLPPLMMLLLAPPVAAWADRHAKRVWLVFGALLIMGFSLLVMAWADDRWGLVLAFLGLSLGYALVLPLGDGLIARMAARHRLEYGRMRSWGSLSFALCSAIFGWLWSQVGYEPMFWIAGLLILALAPSALVFEETPAPPAGERFRWGGLLKDRGLVVVLLVALFFGLGLGFTDPFLAISMERLGGSAFLIGLLFLCIALPELPTMQLEQTLARRLGNAPTLALGCAVFAVGYGLLAIVKTPMEMLLAAPLLGVGYGLIFVGTVRLVDARVKAERISTVQSVRHALAFGITPLLAGPVGGAVFASVGQSFYFLTALCLLVALAVALWGWRELDK